MPRILHLGALVMALAVACKHPDSQRDKQPDTRSAMGGTSSTAAGTVAMSTPAAGAPRDTISDRADRGRIMGDSSAAVWLIMASDFQCPYCKEWHDRAFQQVLKSYVKTGKVRLAFLNMPLSIHPNALPAAEAAMCASIQGKFWQMHEALFASQKDWETLPNPDSALEAIAVKQGVDAAKWRPCYTGHLTRALIQADHDRAIASHVNSTPTFFIVGSGNDVLAGADQDIPAALDKALKARAQKKSGN